jgi:hypothetical protein
VQVHPAQTFGMHAVGSLLQVAKRKVNGQTDGETELKEI